MNSEKGGSNVATGLIVIAIIVAVSVGVVFFKNKSEKQVVQDQATQTTGQEAAQAQKADVANAQYKDGAYSADGTYTTPGGQEAVGVKVTLAGDVIKDVELTQKAKLPVSKVKQADFAAHYKEQVVGKNIDEINLTKVSGSSLTPKGFNAAIEKIKAEAKS